MSDTAKTLINQVLELPALERAVVAEQLLMSLDRPDTELDALWSVEAEARLTAYEQGEIKAVSIADVFGKYIQE